MNEKGNKLQQNKKQTIKKKKKKKKKASRQQKKERIGIALPVLVVVVLG
jgi:hypothetical protein